MNRTVKMLKEHNVFQIKLIVISARDSDLLKPDKPIATLVRDTHCYNYSILLWLC